MHVTSTAPAPSRRPVPRLGIGLAYQPALRPFMEGAPDAFDFLEIMPEMFWNDLGRGVMPRYALSPEGEDFLGWARASGRPVVPHSSGLSIGSAHRFDTTHIAQMARWREALSFPWHSDHLGFQLAEAEAGETSAGVTLPVGLDFESLALVASRVRAVRRQIDAPFLLENNVSYFPMLEGDLDEATFLNRLCDASGAYLLIDVHNLYANGRNRLLDVESFVERLDWDRVLELHVAGGVDFDGFYLDAHSGAVPEPVWALLERVLPRCPNVGGVAFEIYGSWFPEIGVAGLARQLDRARAIWERHRPEPVS